MKPPPSGVTTTRVEETSKSTNRPWSIAGQESAIPSRITPLTSVITDSWGRFAGVSSGARQARVGGIRTQLAGGLRWVGNRWSPLRRAFGDSPLTTGLSLAFLLLLGMLLVRPMVMSLMSYHRTDALLQERRAEVTVLRDRSDRLSTTRDYYRTEAFVVERAREYGLVRPGELSFVVREYAHPESVGTYTRNKVQNLAFGGPANQ